MFNMSILPLINSSFQPGEAQNIVSNFADQDFQEIARAEYYYFSGQAEECSNIAENYLMSQNIKLKMSSCLLYVYSNLTLGRAAASRKGLNEIQVCLEKEMKNAFSREIPQRFSRYKKGKCGKPSGGKSKNLVWG